ncbi:MAG: class I SAM-dependent methyltransferase [Betaproteobacteria bacterium]|nr:MAG: class I SAM-dependent methyltransferase [Betaproteobacteria bacterium]
MPGSRERRRCARGGDRACARRSAATFACRPQRVRGRYGGGGLRSAGGRAAVSERRNVNKDRFEFGKNWRSFSPLIDDEAILKAEDRMASFLGSRDLSGRTFLDIGCGSGLHALVALRFGAKEIVAIDVDPDSVSTARALLERCWQGPNKSVRHVSVFDLDKEGFGEFDIVYSWGVLHHTGNMNGAIEIAAKHVKPGGLFAVALYGKTPYCNLWKRIKRWYVNASPAQQARAERVYIQLFGFYLLLRGKRLSTHIAGYKRKRGMDFRHDVRDWIGGYPYESIAPAELARSLTPLGFDLVKQNVRKRSGLFGSGNDEYLFRKRDASRMSPGRDRPSSG